MILRLLFLALGISAKTLNEVYKNVDPSISSRFISLDLASMLMRKYSVPSYTIKNFMGNECSKIGWVENNRQIEVFCGLNDARIFYTDLKTEQKMNSAKDSEQISRFSESLNDF